MTTTSTTINSLSQLSALAGIQSVGTSPLSTLLTPISPLSISFESIKADLINWALSKPANTAWIDWFPTDDGTIIAEWIAGLATFRKVAEVMRMREASLDFAQLESSIFELAFNRGLLVSPANAPILSLSLTSSGSVAVEIGDLVGNQGAYQLYSLEGKTLAATDTLRCAVGHMNVLTPKFSTLGAFTMFQFPVLDKYIASELEEFEAGTLSIPLVSEPNNLNGFANTFVLRRVLPGQVRVYVGNGVMGWWDPSVPSVTYTCLSYGSDITGSLTTTPNIALAATMTAFTQTQVPSFDPDKETLRSVARYYPIDGRIVQDSDYESVIRAKFGGVVTDVYAFNTDPNEQVYMIGNAAYGVGSAAALQLAAITAMVDSKRGLGMQVFYFVKNQSVGGLSLTMDFKVPVNAYSFTLQQRCSAIATAQLFKFARAAVTLSVVDYATQLSAYFGVPFTPMDADVGLSMVPTDFLSTFNINLRT